MSNAVVVEFPAVSVPALRYAPLLWLALGAFAVGTEGFMIAAILPKVAGDLRVSITAAGQLVTAFALSYAVSSPILTTLTGKLERRTLLIASMAAFAGANLIAAAATGYQWLVAARVLLALAAGLYVPNANALASALAPPERRARAIAVVNGGLTVAIALGVPLGALIGNHFGWRMTFVGVALLAATAVAGLLGGLPKGVGAGLSTATLKERLAVIRLRGVRSGLLLTTLWASGGYAVYTYIAPYLAATTGISGSHIGWVLFVWGASAGTGLFIGGSASDKFGSLRVIAVVLPLLALALLSLSVTAHTLVPGLAVLPVIAAISIWGMSAWAFYPAQQVRLIDIAGMKVAPIILSLNASFMYLGFSLGAALGSFTLLHTTASNLGWVGGTAELLAASLFFITRRGTHAERKLA